MFPICMLAIYFNYFSFFFGLVVMQPRTLHSFTTFQFLQWQVFHGHAFVACFLNHLEHIYNRINILHYKMHELPTQCKSLGGNWPMKLGSNAPSLWLEHFNTMFLIIQASKVWWVWCATMPCLGNNLQDANPCLPYFSFIWRRLDPPMYYKFGLVSSKHHYNILWLKPLHDYTLIQFQWNWTCC
jgi:hypothetical protein